jgi:hypothetical protein
LPVSLAQLFDETTSNQLSINNDGSINVGVSNFPAVTDVSVNNFPAVQDVNVATFTATVDTVVTNFPILQDVKLDSINATLADDTATRLKTSPSCKDEFGQVERLLGDNIYRGVLLTMPVEHHEIHCGDSYEAIYSETLAGNASISFLIIIPDEGLTETFPGEQQDKKQYHLKYIVDTGAQALFSVYEGATVTNNGTAITVFNRNRNYLLTDFIGFFRTPTVTGNGNLIYQRRLGFGRNEPGSRARDDEWILKDNTIYLVTLLNETNQPNIYNFEIDYYVHPGV